MRVSCGSYITSDCAYRCSGNSVASSVAVIGHGASEICRYWRNAVVSAK